MATKFNRNMKIIIHGAYFRIRIEFRNSQSRVGKFEYWYFVLSSSRTVIQLPTRPKLFGTNRESRTRSGVNYPFRNWIPIQKLGLNSRMSTQFSNVCPFIYAKLPTFASIVLTNSWMNIQFPNGYPLCYPNFASIMVAYYYSQNFPYLT